MIMPSGMPIGGSIQNYLRTTKLNMKWEQRQNEMIEKMREKDPQIANLMRDMQNMNKGNITSGIDAKLKAGKRLSPEEMDYLRENSPELYKEAVEIQREREAYERELKQCKTKEEVAKLNMRRSQQFLSEVKAINGNANIPTAKKGELLDKILRRAMAIQDSHTTFISSFEYQKLPSDDEETDEKKKATKKKPKPDGQSGVEVIGNLEEIPTTTISDKTNDEAEISEPQPKEATTIPAKKPPTPAKTDTATNPIKAEFPPSIASNYLPTQQPKSTISIKV